MAVELAPALWRGAAFDRSEAAGVTALKIVAVTCVILGGGSRKRLDAWLLLRCWIVPYQSWRRLQVVATPRNVRGSRLPTPANY
jgi:hypothetical protein